MKESFSTAPFVRSPYNYDRDAASDESALVCPEPSLTQQQFTQECDPNFILDRFIQGGDITLNTREPRYGDFTDMPSSYHEALNFVKETERSFMSLDAKIRAKFDNDPAAYLAFINDPNNIDQMVELGIAERRPETASQDAQKDVDGDNLPVTNKSLKNTLKSVLKGDKGGSAPQDQLST